MRQLTRGVLATLVLVMSACGTDGGNDAPSTASARPVADAALAASSSKISTPEQSGPTSLSVVVTSPEGVGSPGLDAAVGVLAGRPDLAVTVKAPASDVRASPDGRSTSAIAPVDTETMTGHPATAVNGSMLDVVEIVSAPEADRPDLLVIGLSDDAGEGSATMSGARLAVERGIPVLVVVVGGDDPDLAGAALMLAMVTDYELDPLLEAPRIHVLTVPACDGGTVRGPVLVDAADPDDGSPVVDCTDADTGPFDDEADAWASGHATLAHRAG